MLIFGEFSRKNTPKRTKLHHTFKIFLGQHQSYTVICFQINLTKRTKFSRGGWVPSPNHPSKALGWLCHAQQATCTFRIYKNKCPPPPSHTNPDYVSGLMSVANPGGPGGLPPPLRNA